MARPEIIKTPLGERLRAVRRHYNDPSRLEFAQKLGVTDKTLANHERGDSVPDASVLAAYNSHFGINVNWLVTGHGLMFADQSKAPQPEAKPLDEMLMRTLAQIAIRTHQQAQLVLRQEDIAVEAASLYNELKEKADDINDAEEVNDLLPWLEGRLARRLAKLKADPANTTSKRA